MLLAVRCSCIVWLKLKNRMPQSQSHATKQFSFDTQIRRRLSIFPLHADSKSGCSIFAAHKSTLENVPLSFRRVSARHYICRYDEKPFATMNITFECDLLFHFDKMCNNRGRRGRHIQREMVSTHRHDVVGFERAEINGIDYKTEMQTQPPRVIILFIARQRI